MRKVWLTEVNIGWPRHPFIYLFIRCPALFSDDQSSWWLDNCFNFIWYWNPFILVLLCLTVIYKCVYSSLQYYLCIIVLSRLLYGYYSPPSLFLIHCFSLPQLSACFHFKLVRFVNLSLLQWFLFFSNWQVIMCVELLHTIIWNES